MSQTQSYLVPPAGAKAGMGWEPPAFSELCHLWQSISYGEVDIDYDQLVKNNPVLDVIANCSPFLTWILDVRTLQFAFISDNAEALTGYSKINFLVSGLAFLNQITHPADRTKTWQQEKLNWEQLLTMTPQERKAYRFTYENRLLKQDGTVKQMHWQTSVLQQDNKGNITHTVGLCSDSTSPEKQLPNEKEPEIVTEEAATFPDDACRKPKPLLSKRELEIVKLLAGGYGSKYIAEKLCISFHTVNTHRQKIIEKTQAKTTGGVVQYAVANGLV